MKFTPDGGWEELRHDQVENYEIQLVLAFGAFSLFKQDEIYIFIRNQFPMASILFNSSAGEIIGTQTNENSVSVTAIQFEKSKIKTAITDISTCKNSFDAGYYLTRAFDPVGLKNVLLICDSTKVNASQLVFSMQKYFPKDVMITGGLAAPADQQESLIGLNNKPESGKIAAIGFYGNSIQVSFGNMSGWQPFGPERTITRSKDCTVFEAGGIPILEIYNLYLRDKAYRIPVSEMLFPIAVRFDENSFPVIRTIKSVNEGDFSITYAGSVPEGARITLLRSTREQLIEGAKSSAEMTLQGMSHHPELAIVISCSERKRMLEERLNEEIQAVTKIFGNDTALTGFYAPGEISPASIDLKSELFNQSVIITALSEK